VPTAAESPVAAESPAPAVAEALDGLLLLESEGATSPGSAFASVPEAQEEEPSDITDIAMLEESFLGKRSVGSPREVPWAYTELYQTDPEASAHYINCLVIAENGGNIPGQEEQMTKEWMDFLEYTAHDEGDYSEDEKTVIIREIRAMYDTFSEMNGENVLESGGSTDSSPQKKART
jgi:hypothetical protein